jgi:hypothetical protein
MDATDVAWLAGIIEGEGQIAYYLAARSPVLAVSMTDKDIIEKLHTITGEGNVRGPYKVEKPHHTPIWRWSVQNKAGVRRILEAIKPHMGIRRRKQIHATLTTIHWRKNYAVNGRPKGSGALAFHETQV